MAHRFRLSVPCHNRGKCLKLCAVSRVLWLSDRKALRRSTFGVSTPRKSRCSHHKNSVECRIEILQSRPRIYSCSAASIGQSPFRQEDSRNAPCDRRDGRQKRMCLYRDISSNLLVERVPGGRYLAGLFITLA